MVAPLAAFGIGAGTSALGSIFGAGAASRAANQAAQTSLMGMILARRAGFRGEEVAGTGRRRAEEALRTAAATTQRGLGRAREQAAEARDVARGATERAEAAAERAAATTLAGLDRQRATAERAAGLTGAATERAIGRLDPFATGGTSQFNQLLAEQDALTRPFTLDDFEASPGYQFRLQQGQEAINRAAAARGNFFAPESVRRLTEFSQGLASTEFENAFMRNRQTRQDRLNSLLSGAGFGITAGQNIAGLEQQGAGQQAAALLSVPELQGAAQAAQFQQSLADIAQRGAGQEQAAILSTPELQGAAQAAQFQAGAGQAAQTAAGQAINALTGVPYVSGAGQVAGFQNAAGINQAAGIAGAANTLGNFAALSSLFGGGAPARTSTFNASQGFTPNALQVNPNPNLAPTRVPGFSFI